MGVPPKASQPGKPFVWDTNGNEEHLATAWPYHPEETGDNCQNSNGTFG